MVKKKIELPQLLKIREAAQMLSVNPETLRRWDRNGKLKAIIISPPMGEAGPLRLSEASEARRAGDIGKKILKNI